MNVNILRTHRVFPPPPRPARGSRDGASTPLQRVQQIDVAIRAPLTPSDRTEDLQTRNAVAPTQLGHPQDIKARFLHTTDCTKSTDTGQGAPLRKPAAAGQRRPSWHRPAADRARRRGQGEPGHGAQGAARRSECPDTPAVRGHVRWTDLDAGPVARAAGRPSDRQTSGHPPGVDD